MAKFGEGGELLKCSFCGKSQKQVKKLIADAVMFPMVAWRFARGRYDLVIAVGAGAALAGAPLLVLARRAALRRAAPSSNAAPREMSDDL